MINYPCHMTYHYYFNPLLPYQILWGIVCMGVMSTGCMTSCDPTDVGENKQCVSLVREVAVNMYIVGRHYCCHEGNPISL